jgi:hypothetical protein
MALFPSTRVGAAHSIHEDVLLATGSGDETVKVGGLKCHKLVEDPWCRGHRCGSAFPTG